VFVPLFWTVKSKLVGKIMKFSTACLKIPFCLLSTLLVVIAVSVAHAQTNYDVGPGQIYADLEALRIDGIIWKNGDTITLHGDDNSLEGRFLFGHGISVTIQGYGKITPDPAAPPFHPVGGHQDRTITILPDAGKTLTFEGFDAGSQNGGVIDGLGGNSFIILDGAGGGTINFVGNHVGEQLNKRRGGAIYADTIKILDGTNFFINNSSNELGGAIGATIDVTISGGTNTFTKNSADDCGGAIWGNADVTISDGKNLFIDNKAKDGGAIWGNTISSIITFTGGTNTFIDNKANNNGGAISGKNVNLFSGTNSFANNSANKYGGAIYAANTVKLSDGMNTFTNNSADSRGGAISGGNVEISDGTNTFTNNSADGLNPTDGLGGAISGDTVTLYGGTNSFINNSASNDGGAIFSFGSIILFGGTNSFINNLATGYGGAFSANEDIAISGGTNSFTNNSAGLLGGAIFAGEKVTLIADGGDITFRGNIAGGNPNAIYMYNNGNNKNLTLAAEAGRSILLYDPIASYSSNPNLTIDINDGPLYTGTVLFDTHHSIVYGKTTVYGGTMQLANGAIYGAANNVGSFTLKDGATLLSDVRGNTVQANTIKLETGSTLAFDMINATTSTTNLTLSKNIDPTGQKVGEGNIDINTLYSLKAGQYTLVKTDDENYVSDPPATPNVDQAGNAEFFLERSGQNDENLVLNITSAARYTALPGFRPNSYNVADALDQMTDLVIRSEATNILARLGDNSVGLINQIPGDIFANAQFAAVDLRKEFNAILPTHRNILNERATLPSYVYYGQNPENWTGHYARYYKKKLSGMWATPTGRYVGRNSHAGYYGYDLGNAGVALGKSWQLNDKRMIGIAFGYEYARIEMQGVPQKDDMQSFDFALYGGSRKLCGCFTDWHIGYGKNWHDTNRIVAGAKTQSNYDDNVFSFGITTGRHVGLWTPSIGIEMVQVWSPSHTESGSSPFLLHVNRDNYTSIELPVGTRLTKTFSIANRDLTFTPELRAFWVPQLGDQSSSMTTSFASGSTNFIVDSGDFGWQHGRFGTGLTTQLSESLSASVNYDATIYTGQTRQIVSVSLMARF